MDILTFRESSPDTPRGSVSHDLNLSKLWLFNHLTKLDLDPFDNVYILGSWYGSMGLFLLSSKINFEQAYNIDINREKTQYVAHIMKRLKMNDKIHSVTQDCNDVEFKGDRVLVINTSTNDIEGRDWLEHIPRGAVVALQGKNQQEFDDNGVDTLDKFNRAYPLSETLFVGHLTLEDVKGEPYQRFMKIGRK